MTSALQGSWAVDGLKVLLGRKWPTGLGPTGPGRGSPQHLPELSECSHFQHVGLLERPDRPDGSYGPANTGGPAAFSSLPQPGEVPCPSLRRSPRRAAAQPARRHRRRQRPWTRRWGASAPPLPPELTRAHIRLDGRSAARPPRRAARHRSPARVRLYGAATAMARWGAAG
jgi:hypothetical protein